MQDCTQTQHETSCCPSEKKRFDYLLWGSALAVVILYGHSFLFDQAGMPTWYQVLASSVFEFVNTMWWGIVLGIIMLAILARIPREFVTATLGSKPGLNGILRATAAGVLFDLCSHGILMVGAKLYERGATLGQVMAFLIASPWNSFSLTFILIALIGFYWTALFIIFSVVIAVITGLLFDLLVVKKQLPDNPNTSPLPNGFKFWRDAKSAIKSVQWSPTLLLDMLITGIKESRMVMRWMLFGILLAAGIRAFVPETHYANFFGPTLAGLWLTIFMATIIEVCSEGSAPVAADLLTRADAPGNSFSFLMAGVSTDYTEVMVIKETTKSWKIALFLPLLTLPQIITLGWLMNLSVL